MNRPPRCSKIHVFKITLNHAEFARKHAWLKIGEREREKDVIKKKRNPTVYATIGHRFRTIENIQDTQAYHIQNNQNTLRKCIELHAETTSQLSSHRSLDGACMCVRVCRCLCISQQNAYMCVYVYACVCVFIHARAYRAVRQ